MLREVAVSPYGRQEQIREVSVKADSRRAGPLWGLEKNSMAFLTLSEPNFLLYSDHKH